MTRLQEALDLRDQAYFFTRQAGRMRKCGNSLGLWAEDEFFEFSFGSQFLRSGDELWTACIWYSPQGFRRGPSENGHKCLSISWDDAGTYTLTNFKRGEWEELLLGLNSGEHVAPLPGQYNDDVTGDIRRRITDANANPSEFLKRQNGYRRQLFPAYALSPLLGNRAVNLE